MNLESYLERATQRNEMEEQDPLFLLKDCEYIFKLQAGLV
jgi:hypothetical protein